MVTTSRSEQVSAAFVKLAETLVADYHVLDLLQTLVEETVSLLDAAAVGLLLADPHGELQVVASTNEESRLVEMLQLQAGAGPCVECFKTGVVITIDSIDSMGPRWPEFQAAALSQGFHSIHAVPLRVRDRTIGAMGLFGRDVGALTAEDSAIGQALADVATIGLLHERTIREGTLINDQLQRALTGRVLVEQAKGVISQTKNVDLDEAFNMIRRYSRSHHLGLQDTARKIVSGSLTL
ncbi:GAF and ANTAR domain-containing protein [Arthrobacter sp. Bz4]|uniref:GAF and ANTAR domain-containing protein n=1 Tax=Arthrobacter sp. Bz4 TaxID=2171979 RepID=UPI0014041637|nr:GAF and ANTAR domain-containing protein [Arthrobacter sp. Bz4]